MNQIRNIFLFWGQHSFIVKPKVVQNYQVWTRASYVTAKYPRHHTLANLTNWDEHFVHIKIYNKECFFQLFIEINQSKIKQIEKKTKKQILFKIKKINFSII